MQKTKENIGWRQKGRTESESNGGVQTYMGIVDDNLVEVQLVKVRGHLFVRYADDCIVLVKSLRATERVRDSIANYVEKKLFLKVNKEKTVIGTLAGKKFLGYSFY